MDVAVRREAESGYREVEKPVRESFRNRNQDGAVNTDKKPDNKTAHAAAEYDGNIRRSIPFYDLFHEATINVVASFLQEPENWVDIGCGTGTLVEKAYDLFPSTRFMLADPSAAMLDIARMKMAGKNRVTILDPVMAEDIALSGKADVISAIQSLHYLGEKRRGQSVRNCFNLLREGGIFVTFENIRPLTGQGTVIGKKTWQRYEMRAGKSEDEARKHIDRFGEEYFPITVEEHLNLLRGTGFSTVELLWYSCLQAGFYGVK